MQHIPTVDESKSMAVIVYEEIRFQLVEIKWTVPTRTCQLSTDKTLFNEMKTGLIS